MKRCPFCVEKMQDIAVVCPHCGRDYPQSGEYAVLGEQIGQTDERHGLNFRQQIVMGILVAVLIASGWVSWFINRNNTTVERTNFESAMATQSLKLAEDQIVISKISGTRMAQEQQLAANQVVKSTLEALSAQQEADNSTLVEDLAFAKSQQVNFCKEADGLSWDYTNNETILAQLKSFSENLGGNVSKATYTLPWNIQYLAVYTVNTKYVLWFIVYFEQKELGFTNTIYWVDANCYLDKN